MHVPSLSPVAAPLLTRKIAGGPNSAYRVELSVLEDRQSTWFLIRDVQANTLGNHPVLAGAFEYVATLLRHEWVYLRGRPDVLRFFHAQAEMVPTGTLRWTVKEVELELRNEQYIWAKWVEVPLDQLRPVTATLSSWGPPQRKRLRTG